MNDFARRSGIPSSSLAFAVLALAFVCRTASAAQVVEPNGTVVPTATTMDPVSLQQYFTSVNENINVVANASITPATFMPLCNFQATLVLSQSSAQGGLAWYNVPDATTDPNHTQTPTVYPIGTFPMTVGAAVASSDIRSNAAYAGGLVGFALLKNLGSGAVPVYYSEDTRNADCTGCTAAGMMPGYWKMMLSYESTVTSNEYYMAWEDWEGANTTTWFGNDGDFNDKVFAISGVTCDGGGVPCQVPMGQGVCANGITQCVVGGTPTCNPTIEPTPEKCDNLDNDCNGMVDDGTGLCPGSQVCVQGQCIDPCSTTEFPCGPPLVCVNGLCVDPGCENKTCKVGQVCHGGTCVGGCDGVQCPTNQICELGVCVDPCAGVTCKGSVCVLGVCVQNCSCQACPKGQVCAATGACVDDGCDTMTCGAGEVCSNGTCGDACANAKCPGGAACQNGQCGTPPPPPPPTGAGGSSATGGAGGTLVGTGGAGGRGGSGAATGGATGAGGTLATGGSTGTTGGGGTGAHESGVVSCSCTSAGPRSSGGALLMALMALAALSRRRARR